MSIVPGDNPAPRQEPLLNEDPPPPGVENYSDDVDALEQRIRERGPDEVQRADERADAVEGDGQDGGPGSRSDAEQDPTSDEGADPEDPEAQDGDGPSTADTD